MKKYFIAIMAALALAAVGGLALGYVVGSVSQLKECGPVFVIPPKPVSELEPADIRPRQAKEVFL